MQVWQSEESFLRFLLGTVDHLAPELRALDVLIGGDSEKAEHGIKAVDVEAWWGVEDTGEKCLSVFGPSHRHVLGTEILDAQVQDALFIQQRAQRLTVDEHHIRRSSCLGQAS